MLFRFVLFVCVILGAARAQAPKEPADSVTDPFGRATPRTTVVNFLRVAQDRNDATAAVFLEISGRPGDPGSNSARALSQKLKAVLDSASSINLNEISSRPEGALDDALRGDLERIGTIQSAKGSVDLTLHRVNVARVGMVWLFSADTLRQIPALYDEVGPPTIERVLPEALVQHTFFGVAWWRWLALLVLIPLASAVAWAASVIILRISSSLARRTSVGMDDRIVPLLQGPLNLFLAVCVFHPAMLAVEPPLLLRQGLGQIEMLLAVIAIAWFAMRLIDLASAQTRESLIRKQRIAAVSIIPLGRRFVKILAVSLACLVILDNAGFDLKAVLTGLGVGGIAVALAAQKTLENIFGAIALVLDQPVRVGDFCKFGDSMGTVEDIGLRSTRIRTLDNTVLSVPNSSFSTMGIENFALRQKWWFHPTLAVRLDTTAAQVRYIQTEVQRMLDEHPKVEKGSRIRLSALAPAAIKLDVFSYLVLKADEVFEVVQEELLMRMMQIVEDAGTSLSMPAQTGYLTRSVQADADHARAAATQVREWEGNGHAQL